MVLKDLFQLEEIDGKDDEGKINIAKYIKCDRILTAVLDAQQFQVGGVFGVRWSPLYWIDFILPCQRCIATLTDDLLSFSFLLKKAHPSSLPVPRAAGPRGRGRDDLAGPNRRLGRRRAVGALVQVLSARLQE